MLKQSAPAISPELYQAITVGLDTNKNPSKTTLKIGAMQRYLAEAISFSPTKRRLSYSAITPAGSPRWGANYLNGS
jgi:hypothetical protein